MICCYCDNALSCGACGMEQPDDSAEMWRPIETAPHEEQVLLGWWYAPRMDSKPRWECEVGEASRGWTRNGISTMSRHGQATHWQPLPSHPKGKSDGAGGNQPEQRTGPHRASGETNSGATGDSELTRSARLPSDATYSLSSNK